MAARSVAVEATRLPARLQRHMGLVFEAARPIGVPLAYSCAPDVTVCEGPAASSGDSTCLHGERVAFHRHRGVDCYSVVRHAGGYAVRVHTLSDFLISPDATSVECRPLAGADPDVASVLLAGTVTAFLWMLRGRAVLHGSAVRHGSRAIALLGPSGSGKSTVAALCCAAGAQLLSDDLLVLEHSGDEVWCVGRATEVRLRPGMRPVTQIWPVKPPERATADGRTAVCADPVGVSGDQRVPLGVVALLFPSPQASAVRLTRLSGSNALLALMGQSRLTGLGDSRFNADLLAAAAAVARKVPVVAAEVPWQPPFSLESGRQILHAMDALTAVGGHV